MDSLLVILIPIGVSLGTLMMAVLNTRRKAENDYVIDLEKRIVGLEARMKQCEEERDKLAGRNQDLVQQNTDLLKRIVEEKILGDLNTK